MRIYNSYLFNYFFVNDIYISEICVLEKNHSLYVHISSYRVQIICRTCFLSTLSDISTLSSIWYIYRADVTRGITSRRIASHRIASHRIARPIRWP